MNPHLKNFNDMVLWFDEATGYRFDQVGVDGILHWLYSAGYMVEHQLLLRAAKGLGLI